MELEAEEAIMKDNRLVPSSIDEKGQKLRLDFEHASLRRMIRDVKQNKVEPEEFRRLFREYCELKKQDWAAEKILSSLRDCGSETTGKARTKGNEKPLPYRDEASSGVGDDDASGHREDSRRALENAVHDLYGLSLPSDVEELPEDK